MGDTLLRLAIFAGGLTCVIATVSAAILNYGGVCAANPAAAADCLADLDSDRLHGEFWAPVGLTMAPAAPWPADRAVVRRLPARLRRRKR